MSARRVGAQLLGGVLETARLLALAAATAVATVNIGRLIGL